MLVSALRGWRANESMNVVPHNNNHQYVFETDDDGFVGKFGEWSALLGFLASVAADIRTVLSPLFYVMSLFSLTTIHVLSHNSFFLFPHRPAVFVVNNPDPRNIIVVARNLP